MELYVECVLLTVMTWLLRIKAGWIRAKTEILRFQLWLLQNVF